MTRITDDEYGKFMWDSIKQLCDDFGPRPPTSEAERQAALSYEKELGKYCNETVVDTFETRPNAYPQGFVRLVAVISCLAFFFFIFTFPFNLLTILLCILGLWIFYSTLFQQKEWIHVLFKKESSQNVFGIIKPQKATRVRVLFGGAATWTRLGNQESPNSVNLSLSLHSVEQHSFRMRSFFQ